MGSKRFENSQTTNLQHVLLECMAIQELVAEKENPPEVKVEDESSVRKPNQVSLFSLYYQTCDHCNGYNLFYPSLVELLRALAEILASPAIQCQHVYGQ